jgi:hypothetical protein
MALTGRTTIDPPPSTAPLYGLYSVATVTTDAGTGDRWEAGGAEYTSVMCAQGAVWAVGCGPAFTATITKTAVANQWQVTLAPTVGPYEFTINPTGTDADVYSAMVNGGTFTVPNANSVVVIRETTGLRRRVSFTGVSNVAATSTTQTGTSSTQAYNDPKTGDGKAWTTSDPFTVLAGVSCGSLGTLDVDDQARATAALAAAEQRLVEATFERGNIDPRLAGAGAVVTPAGTDPIKVKRAIGALEQYLRAEYGGTGVLHASPALAEYMAPTKDGAVLRTKLGTPIAFGSGYTGVAPAGTAPAADQLWIYATGAVAVRRSAVDIPATGAQTLDRATNQTLLIAERAIMVSIDCVPVAAALVDLAAEDA